MRRPQGYLIVTSERGVIEHDTITCSHCNQIVMVKAGSADTVYYLPQMEGPPKEEAGAFCRQCMSSICLSCLKEGRCYPLERRIEEMEAKGRLLRSVGL